MWNNNQMKSETNNILLELDTLKMYKEYNRDYEEKVVDLIQQFKDVENLEEKFEVLLSEIIDANPYNEEVSYAAYFTLCTIYRRRKHFSRYHVLVSDKKFVRIFDKFISFGHLKSMCLVEIAKTRRDLLEAIECSKTVLDKVESLKLDKANIGFYHSFAINVAKGFEDSYLNSPRDDEYFKLAKNYANKSIDCDVSYAKFHSTLGRLYLVERQYKEAIDECSTAIDYEKHETEGYTIRVNDYQNYILTAKTFLNIEKLNDTLYNEVKNKLADMQSRNIEVLVFFVSIMSFVIGSIQLINDKFDFVDIAALIVLLFGCLLTVLGAFGRNLNGSDKRNYFFSIMFGVIMIISAFILHFISPFILHFISGFIF